jgi:hypothetical protein
LHVLSIDGQCFALVPLETIEPLEWAPGELQEDSAAWSAFVSAAEHLQELAAAILAGRSPDELRADPNLLPTLTLYFPRPSQSAVRPVMLYWNAQARLWGPDDGRHRIAACAAVGLDWVPAKTSPASCARQRPTGQIQM